MPLHPGQILRGARWNYLITETLRPQTSTSNIFKAQILPHAHLHPPGPWAAIKTASDQKTLDMLKWEYRCYQNPAIHSSPYLRTLYESLDVHDSSTPGSSYGLAFEWMDITLKDLSAKKHHQNRVLHKSVSKGVLSALDVLNSQCLVHTDIKNDNIFISSADEPIPTVKPGDLGLVRAEGFDDYSLQPLALRAPEVWSGKGCFHSSDVWVATTVGHGEAHATVPGFGSDASQR